jgi:hypothetical protein
VCFAFVLITSIAGAQVPDVTVKLDAALTYRTTKDSKTTVESYDLLARPSIVSLQFKLEPGFRAFIAERFQKIPNDGDTEQLAEYFIEDPGIWRLGKQQAPFGQYSLIRMNIKGARGDLDLPIMDAPLKIELCDDGENLSRGVVGRAGKRLGLSFAVGRNFGIQSGCLAQLRSADGSLGKGKGYQQMYGLDYSRKLGIWRVQAEVVALRQGETSTDRNLDVSDIVFTLEPNKEQSLSLAWSRNWGDSWSFYRAEGRFKLTRNVWFEPILRYRNGVFYDAGFSVRVKL